MRVAIVTFDGFSELDSVLTLALINQLRPHGVMAELCGPPGPLSSMNGLQVQAPHTLEFAARADAVLFAGGLYSRAVAANGALMDRLVLDPTRQLLGAQGSGSLILARLGLLGDQPACSDPPTRQWLIEAGVRACDLPFHARGPVATAGGGLAAAYLAAWVMCRAVGRATTRHALLEVAPEGDRARWADQVLGVVGAALDESGHSD